MINKLSELPYLSSSESLYLNKIQEILLDNLDYLEENQFGFNNYNGLYCIDPYRRTYAIKKLFSSNAILKELLEQFIKIDLQPIVKDLLETLSIKFTQNDIGMVLRVRLFSDQPGYSLDPHKDSSDTLLSILKQFNKKNPKTKVFKIKYEYSAKVLPNTSHKKALTSLIQSVSDQKPLIYFVNNTFSPNHLTAWIKNDFSCWSSKFCEIENRLDAICYENIEYSFPDDHVLFLHNIKKSESIYEKDYGDDFFHGVYPEILFPRKVLLIDLITQDKNGSNSLILKDMYYDKNSVYASLKDETINTLLGI